MGSDGSISSEGSGYAVPQHGGGSGGISNGGGSSCIGSTETIIGGGSGD
jgi:hypothetical protein